MATSRNDGRSQASSVRSDRWGLVGLCGIFISGFAVLAFVGYFASDTLVVTGAAQAIAFVLGRAGVLATVAGVLIGGALVIAGARRRPNIDVTHFIAACVFLAAPPRLIRVATQNLCFNCVWVVFGVCLS